MRMTLFRLVGLEELKLIGASGWNYNSSEWQNTTLVGPGGPRGLWLTLSYAIGSSANAE